MDGIVISWVLKIKYIKRHGMRAVNANPHSEKNTKQFVTAEDNFSNKDFENLSLSQLSEELTVQQQLMEQKNDELLTRILLQNIQKKINKAEQLDALFEALPAGIILLDAKGQVIHFNSIAQTLLATSLENRLWRDIIIDAFNPQSDDGHEVSSRQGKHLQIQTASLATKLTRVFDGNRVNKTLVNEESGTKTQKQSQLVLITDQTETRRLQKLRSRSERLSALGKMVATLAHQLRTPLTVALLYANHLQGGELTSNKAKQFADKLVNRLESMEKQIRNMLFYAKGDIKMDDKLSVAELIESHLDAISPLISRHQIQNSLRKYPSRFIIAM